MNISGVTSITNAALNEQLLQQSGLVQPSTPVPSTGTVSPVSNGTVSSKAAAAPASSLTATPSKEPYSPQLRNYAAGLQVMQASSEASAAISSAIDPGSTATLADRVDLLNKGISLAALPAVSSGNLPSTSGTLAALGSEQNLLSKVSTRNTSSIPASSSIASPAQAKEWYAALSRQSSSYGSTLPQVLNLLA